MIDININKISKNYGINKVFKDITFTIKNKERICITGPNGSGKTTILNLIANLDTPTSGEIFIRKNTTIGYLPQMTPTYPKNYTVKELFEQNIPTDYSEITTKLKKFKILLLKILIK